jgi:hypothetical protein
MQVILGDSQLSPNEVDADFFKQDHIKEVN